MKCINIYTIISPHLDNRTKYINSTLSKLKEIADELDIKIELYSVTQPSPELIQENIEEYNKRVDYTPPDDDFEYKITPLNLQNISNIEKHRQILKNISQQNEKDYHLVLEDDVLINTDYIKNIREFFTKIIENKFQEWEMILTCMSLNENTDDLYIDDISKHTKLLLNKSSYMIRPQTALKLYDFLNIFKYNFKIGLSKFINANKCKAFFLNKHTFLEGSKMGIFPSSTNTDNVLYQSKEYMEIHKIIRNISDSNNKKDDVIKAETIYEKVKDLPGPDITYSMGLLYYKVQDYKNARKYMTEACFKLQKEKGLLSKSSTILNNAINICQYDQYKLEKYKKKQSKYY